MKFIKKSYASYTKDTHIWCRSAKFLSKLKSCSGSGPGSWFDFGFQYQTYTLYIEDTHRISFGSANSFESYCVHSQTGRHPDRQTSRQTYIQTDGYFFCLFCVLGYTKHEHSSKGENFFLNYAITIRSDDIEKRLKKFFEHQGH